MSLQVCPFLLLYRLIYLGSVVKDYLDYLFTMNSYTLEHLTNEFIDEL